MAVRVIHLLDETTAASDRWRHSGVSDWKSVPENAKDAEFRFECLAAPE